jgi:hypothetical protein
LPTLRQFEKLPHAAHDLARRLEGVGRRQIEPLARRKHDARIEAVERGADLDQLDVGDLTERNIDRPARKEEQPAVEAGGADVDEL